MYSNILVCYICLIFLCRVFLRFDRKCLMRAFPYVYIDVCKNCIPLAGLLSVRGCDSIDLITSRFSPITMQYLRYILHCWVTGKISWRQVHFLIVAYDDHTSSFDELDKSFSIQFSIHFQYQVNHFQYTRKPYNKSSWSKYERL